MEGNFKRRVGLAGDRDGEIGGLLESMQIDAKIFEPVGEAGLQDQARTLAHRRSCQQRKRKGVGTHGRRSHRGRAGLAGTDVKAASHALERR